MEELIRQLTTVIQEQYPASHCHIYENGINNHVDAMKSVETQLKKQADVNLQAVMYERKTY